MYVHIVHSIHNGESTCRIAEVGVVGQVTGAGKARQWYIHGWYRSSATAKSGLRESFPIHLLGQNASGVPIVPLSVVPFLCSDLSEYKVLSTSNVCAGVRPSQTHITFVGCGLARAVFPKKRNTTTYHIPHYRTVVASYMVRRPVGE
jgi:hypothetical protein